MSYRTPVAFSGRRSAALLSRTAYFDLNECLTGVADFVRYSREEEAAIFARLDECRMPWESRSDCAGRHPPTRELLDSFAANNLFLVATIASAYHRKNKNLSIKDLFQAGSLAVLNAIDKFDPARGNKFSTYTSYAIRQHMVRWMGESQFIFVPVWANEALHAIHQAERKGEPVRSVRVKDSTRARHSGCLDAARRVLGVFVGSKEFADLDKEGRESDPAEVEMEAEEHAWKRFQVRRLLALLARDHPRHAEAVALRYNLDGLASRGPGSLRTLDEVGDALGVGKERARQLIDAGMKLIRRIAEREEDAA